MFLSWLRAVLGSFVTSPRLMKPVKPTPVSYDRAWRGFRRVDIASVSDLFP